jgi:hypothetical protein
MTRQKLPPRQRMPIDRQFLPTTRQKLPSDFCRVVGNTQQTRQF